MLEVVPIYELLKFITDRGRVPNYSRPQGLPHTHTNGLPSFERGYVTKSLTSPLQHYYVQDSDTQTPPRILKRKDGTRVHHDYDDQEPGTKFIVPNIVYLCKSVVILIEG